MAAGTAALPSMEDLLGLNGNDKAQAAISALQSSPLYKSLYNNGQEAILANGAATGGLRGGNMQGALADFGRDTLSSVIQSQLGNLGGLVGLGEGATNQVTGFNQSNVNNQTALTGAIGKAQATGDYQIGQLNANMWNSAGSFLDQIAGAAMGAFPGLGGGGSGGVPSFLTKLF